MENTNTVPKKKFRIPKLPKWIPIIAVLIVAVMGIFAISAIAKSASKNPGEKLFDKYVSAVKSQNPSKYASLFYKKGTAEYNDLVKNYKDGKAAYKNFLSSNPKTGSNYKSFWESSRYDYDEPAEYGLHLWAESQIAKGIKDYTATTTRLSDSYVEIYIVLNADAKFNGTVLPTRYQGNGDKMPESVVVSACKIDGKWYFGNEFSLYKAGNQEELDTWYAPYDKDGVELMHVGYVSGQKNEEFDLSEWNYEGKPIVSIGDYAFASRAKTLKKVILPAGLKNIGQYAFKGCEELTDIVFSDGSSIADKNITLGEGAFYNCRKLKSFAISQNTTLIAPYLFYNCAALESFDIVPSVNTIGHYAFYGCSKLTSVSIPDTVTVISDGAFEKCSALVSFNDNNRISEKVIRLGSSAFRDCTSLVSVALPESISELNSALFQGCTALKNVDLPQGLVRIGNNCFAGSGIVELTLPKNVEFIGKGAFSNCLELSEFEWHKAADGKVDAKIRAIGENAFTGNKSLYKFILPESLKSLGAGAFLGCEGLRYVMLDCRYDIDMGDKVFELNDGIPKLYTKFSGEGYIENDRDGNPVTGDTNLYAFTRKTPVWNRLSLEIYSQSIIQNDMAIMTEGGENTLIQYTGNATEVTLSGIHRINRGAFSHNTQIEKLNINSAEIKAIGEDVFNGCSNFAFDRYKNDEGELLYVGDWLVYGAYYNTGEADLQLFEGKDLYLDASTTFKLDSTGKAPTTVGIAAMAFAVRGLSVNLAQVHLPKSIKYIGEEAFSGTSITTLTFELENSNLDTIGEGAFERCELLNNVTLPSTLKTISNNAFYGCKGLRYVIVNSPETVVGNLAFEYSYSLIKDADSGEETEIREFYFDTLKLYIKDYNSSNYYKNDANWGIYKDFIYDSSILKGSADSRYAIIDNTIIQYLGESDEPVLGIDETAACTIIGAGAFAGSYITDVIIGSNIARIEQNAFYSCERLLNVTFKAGTGGSSALAYIGNFAFGNCKTLSNQSDATVDMTEISQLNASFAMGKNVFDEGLNRKIFIKVREHFVSNTYWQAYADAIAATDDPSVIVYISYVADLEGDAEYRSKWKSWINILDGNTIKRAPDANVLVIASPDDLNGYEFVGWFKGAANGEMVSEETNYTIVFGGANADDEYYAVFQRTKTRVSAKVETPGGKIVDITGGKNEDWVAAKNGLYNVDDTMTFKAVTTNNDNYDYKFLGWFVDDDKRSEEIEYSHKLTSFDLEIEARFDVLSSKLTFSANSGAAINGGTVSAVYAEDDTDFVSGSKVAPDTEICFTATVNEGFKFVGWFLNGSDEQVTVLTYSLIKNKNTQSVEARFRKILNIEFSAVVFDKDDKQTTDVGGTIDYDYTGSEFINENKITLKAIEGAEYKLYRWQYNENMGDGDPIWVDIPGADNSLATTDCLLPLTSEIRAVFKKASILTVEVSSDTEDAGGTVNVESGKQIIGTNITLTASPKDGYKFVGWFIEGEEEAVSVIATYAYTVTEDNVVLIARFELE